MKNKTDQAASSIFVNGNNNDDAEIDTLRAEMRAAGLLPDLPPALEPTVADTEAALEHVLLAGLAATAADNAAEARRRRSRITKTLFGLAATGLIGAAILAPFVTRTSSVADVAPMELDLPEAINGRSAEIEPVDLPADPTALGLLTGTVADTDGCLVVETPDGLTFVPVTDFDAPAPVAFTSGEFAPGDVVILTGRAATDADLPLIDLPGQCRLGAYWIYSAVEVGP